MGQEGDSEEVLLRQKRGAARGLLDDQQAGEERCKERCKENVRSGVKSGTRSGARSHARCRARSEASREVGLVHEVGAMSHDHVRKRPEEGE